MANILYSVFQENCYDYPQSFDDFGRQVAEKLYTQFKFMQGNTMVFNKQKNKAESVFKNYVECVANTEQSVLEMVEPIELVEDLDHLSIDDVGVSV
jgi:hypothetical protein